MIRLNIREFKTHMSRYLDQVSKGETILLCKRNQPIAEVRPIQQQPKTKRPIGLDKGTITMHDSFFDPIP